MTPYRPCYASFVRACSPDAPCITLRQTARRPPTYSLCSVPFSGASPQRVMFCPTLLEGIEKATKEQMVEGFVQVVTSLKNSLNEYLCAGRDVYIAVQKQAKENCDLVLDGFLSVDELTQQLVSAVKDKPRTRATT